MSGCSTSLLLTIGSTPFTTICRIGDMNGLGEMPTLSKSQVGIIGGGAILALAAHRNAISFIPL